MIANETRVGRENRDVNFMITPSNYFGLQAQKKVFFYVKRILRWAQKNSRFFI
jgi:hypothetical protein